MTLLLTGGHLTPALACIDYLQKSSPDSTILFVGRMQTQNGTRQRSREQEEVEKRKVPFIPFSTGKLVHGSLAAKLLQIFPFSRSLTKAFGIIGRYRPDAVVSFGSYVAVPIALAAWIWRVPVITHEQTRTAGIANSLIGKVAHTVALAHPESAQYFPTTKTVVTGNLIRQTLFTNTTVQPSWFTENLSKPLLYITGGNQGSEVLNTTVSQCLTQLVRDWTVIHQCGAPTAQRNYKKDLQAYKRALNPQLRKRYFIREWIQEHELAWIYQHATASISRAGANTVDEIVLHAIPTIFIPLPFSHRDEQLLNAKAISKSGGALLLPQQHLSPDLLVKKLEEISKNHASMQQKLTTMKPKDGTADFCALVQKIAA